MTTGNSSNGELAELALMLAIISGLAAWWSGYNPFFWFLIMLGVSMTVAAAMDAMID